MQEKSLGDNVDSEQLSRRKGSDEASKRPVPNPNFIRFVPVVTAHRLLQRLFKSYIFSLKELINYLYLQATGNTITDHALSNGESTPFLICAMSGNEKKGDFYIYADRHLIEVGKDGLVAVDILIKLHLCFDIKFSPDLDMFYSFICPEVMSITNQEFHRPSNKLFNSSLSHITEAVLNR
ncbi:hypothetical protein QAD02_000731 [Eretmocerus hayati]|uniref:Uncharacterized protein n=1 Tax=Eretmocerus hayati TaxID=131215 RepID=A0ACC2NEE0_9HYME|nr:hypothetical protein QAD02_000731 [Eretmocerus hayati]